MKYITTFIGSLLLFIATSYHLEISKIESTNTIKYAIFDGNEGDLYFFTDTDEKAVTIKDKDTLLFKHFNHQANYYVGKKFKFIVKTNELINNVCESNSVTEIELSSN